MTYVLNLEPDTVKRIEEKAALQGITPEKLVAETLASAFDETREERLQRLTQELFEDRASAYDALAEGAK
ncbi:hypothetical protein IAD21_04999 [Abditibacteriota bacterium]|nr:hypothetical protein IAD21_04999 [Abditibacteriota bacterium]